MTLIVGLNLSDRLYLGADTRVTFPDGTHNDNIIKVAHLSGEPFPLIGQKNPNTIFIAVAGSLTFATYLYKKIKRSIDEETLSSDIRKLYEEIDEYIKKKTDEWLKTNKYQNCCIIFAGMDDERRKEINPKRLQELQEKVKKNVTPLEELQKARKQLENDPFFQELAKKIPQKNLMRPFEEPDAMVINPIIEQAIKKNERMINAPDGLIFSVLISKRGVNKEKAEWGEFLAYGTNGITKKDLAEEFLARMELGPGQLVNKKDMMETHFIRNHILKIAEKNKIKEIGGAVTPVTIRNNMYQESFGYRHMTLEGKVIEEVFQTTAGIFFRKNNNRPVQLIDFFVYQTDDSKAQL